MFLRVILASVKHDNYFFKVVSADLFSRLVISSLLGDVFAVVLCNVLNDGEVFLVCAFNKDKSGRALVFCAPHAANREES